MKKIAVTGAAGKVGKQVVKELLKNNYEVLSITHSPRNIPGDEISLDVAEYKEVYNALAGCEGIIHLAAIPGPRKQKDALVLKTNTIGTYNILKAAGERDINRVAVASTDCTLGFTFSKNKPVPEYLPVDEKHPLKPDDSYGLSKVFAEKAAEAMVQRYPGMSVASLRITYVANPEDYKSDFFLRSLKNPEIDPWNLWSYIDNRDAARAFRISIEKDLAGHEIFFIAASNTRSYLPSQELIKRFYPAVKLKQEIKGHQSLEDSSKAEKILGFKAKYRWNDFLNY